MTRPEDIPEDVWRHAESVAAAYSNAVNDVWILNSCVRRLRARAEIARALMAAEQRGAERAAAEIGEALEGLLDGNFSSLTIGFNDDHACNYATAQRWHDEFGFYRGDEDDRIEWSSEAERQKAIADNRVWTIQWYPATPVGFHCVGASSLPALLDAIRKGGGE